MTTQPKPDLAAIVAAVDEFRQNITAAARRAWPRVAAALTPTQDEFALVPNDVAHEQPKPDHKRDLAALWALAACLNGDDQHAAELLAGLDATQLYAIEGAASGLAIHASRHRKRLDEAEQDGPAAAGRRVSVDEYERLLAADERLVEILARRDADHAHRIEQAKTEADERVAFVERQRAAWEADAKRHLGNADYWRQRAETAERRAEHFEEHAAQVNADLGIETQRAAQAERERDEERAIRKQAEEIIAIAHQTSNQSERERAAAEARANTAERRLDIADRVNAALKAERDKARRERDEQQHRAETAERERDKQRQRAARPDVQATALLRRAETAERSAAAWQADARRFDENSDHWRKRADEAERERDEQRQRAAQAETEVRVSQGTTRELLTALADTRQRAEAAEATVNAARQQVERWRYQQDRRRAAAEMAPILGIDLSDRTDDPDAWRP